MSSSPFQYGIEISAESLAQQTGFRSLSWAFDGVWEVLLQNYGSTDAQKMDAILGQRLRALDAVRSGIAAVHRQIDRYQPDISRYPLAAAVSTIEARYREFEDSLDNLLERIRQQAAGAPEIRAQRFEASVRLSDVSLRAGREIGANLSKLQRVLNRSDGNFVDEFYQEHRERDFMSFFYGTKFGYARLYLAQVKAFLLLHLAHKDPRNPYRLSTELNDFEEQTHKSEYAMFCTLHQPVQDLVRQLAQESDGVHAAAAVTLRVPGGDGLRLDNEDRLQASSCIEEWRLELMESWLYSPTVDHRFRLRQIVSDRILVLDDVRGASGIQRGKRKGGERHDDSTVLEGWSIAFEPGPGAFRLKYQGRSDDPNTGKNLVSHDVPNGHKVEGRMLSQYFDRDRLFQIVPYKVTVKEQLRVDEYLRPGDYLKSPADTYRLYYRHGGAVEVVRTGENKAVWAVATTVVLTATGRLLLQADGNFVAYTQEGFPYWATDKYFKDQQALYRNSVLTLRDDGRVQIALPGKEPFWQSPA